MQEGKGLPLRRGAQGTKIRIDKISPRDALFPHSSLPTRGEGKREGGIKELKRGVSEKFHPHLYPPPSRGRVLKDFFRPTSRGRGIKKGF
jgi:hypothetical protein